MLKKPKERILAIILLAIVGLSTSHSFLTSSILAPLEAKEKRVKALSERVNLAEFEYRRISHAQKHLADTFVLSLPQDSAVATAFYQQWLIDKSIVARIQDAQVTAGRPDEIAPAGYRIPFTVQAEMTIQQLSELLDQIQAQPLLHNVRHITIASSSSHKKTIQHNVTIGIETLCLNGASERETLIDSAAKDLSPNLPQQSLSKLLVERNSFEAGYAGPRVRKTRSPVRMTPPSAKLQSVYRFIAGLTVNGESEAWLYDKKNRMQKVVHEGTHFDIHDVRFEVSEIQSDRLVLAVDDELIVLAIGESIPQAKHRLSQR